MQGQRGKLPGLHQLVRDGIQRQDHQELLPLGLGGGKAPREVLQADEKQRARQHCVPVRLRRLLAARAYPARHQGLERDLRKLTHIFTQSSL